ncbi:RHO1 GDP-GTP exchange protein 2 [Boothiomyces sp. JEL0838]|nr:RHO1 GDP-GTP exchange protein 2 [Boothiomyces sp. JEL0838]
MSLARRESTTSVTSIPIDIYPALLSQVGKEFISRIVLSTHSKDTLEYSDSFNGKQAVDLLSQILKTKDRNVAILIGRALDAQGIIHDVTWSHRLRDSVNEIYKLSHSKDEGGLQGNSKTEPIAELWSSMVPIDVVQSTSKSEITRQETIYEIIVTEKEFVADLENTINLIIQPLKERDIIEPSKRESFIKDVFSNITDLHAVNSKLLKKLISRQKESYVVEKVGDIFVNISNEIYPYIEYGSQQAFAKSILDEERQCNAELARFLKECEKYPEFRKLPIESFLARPTTRLGRYPLLLKPVLEKAAENNPDKTLIPQALAAFKTVLTTINIEAGKAENLLRLGRLQKQIFGLEPDQESLKLNEEGRQIIRDGKLIMKKTPNEIEISVFLFDHLLLLTRKKESGYKVTRRPVPLELLTVKNEKTANPMKGVTAAAANIPGLESSRSYPITLNHLGRFGGTIVLYANTQSDKLAWIEAIEKQKALLIERKKKFDNSHILIDSIFPKSNPINASCVVQNQLIIGTESGVFIGSNPIGELCFQRFTQVLSLEKVAQVDAIPKNDILLVLSDKTLLSFSLKQVLEFSDNAQGEKLRPKKISSNVSFFKQGICNNLTLVCAVKSTTITANVKVLEPMGLGVINLQGKLAKVFKATSEPLREKTEFYIPSESKSIHFLNTKLCVGCTKGFELVVLDTLKTQSLLDPMDESLDFVLKKETVRPIAIFKMKDNNFFLCYNDFGFYIDKLGRRVKHDWIVYWSGIPNAFSYVHPYIIAFEPNFIEVRNLETGNLQQIITTQNLRVLSTDSSQIMCVMDSTETEFQAVFRLHAISEFL